MALLCRATYAASAATLAELPNSLCEVAFAGRSNAGKSSAINTLARKNRLAHVSQTPGRTQLINFYALGEGKFLVDLPGYGYARVPPKLRERWEKVLPAYLQTRETLAGLMLIMDARHPLTPLDKRMLDWFAPRGLPVHVLLTKADKLSHGAATQTLREVRVALKAWPQVSVQLFSSLTRLGVEEAESVIAGWLSVAARAGEKERKNPGQGDRPGVNDLHLPKVPAQGGEAGDSDAICQQLSGRT